jgi:hypothetical protein
MRFNDLYSAYSSELQDAFLELEGATIDSGYYRGMDAAERSGMNRTPDNRYTWWESSDADCVFVNSRGLFNAPDGAVAFSETDIVVYGDDATGWTYNVPMLLLDDVLVVGQRRPDGATTTLPNGLPVGGSIDPCLVPSLRRHWNTDAAAADALNKMLDKAEEVDGYRDLAAREYGMVLCEFSTGIIAPGAIVYLGETFLDENGVPCTRLDENGVPQPVHPTVDVDFDGCPNGSTIIGMIHSHRGGQVPSGADSTWLPSIDFARGGDGFGRIYVASQGPSGARMNVYNAENVEAGVQGGITGPEVNPNGVACTN